MRLAKFIAHGGVASRRGAEKLIGDGLVTVDGKTITDPARDVDESNVVLVNGERVQTAETVVYAVYKPIGVISTADDPEGRPTVVELVGSDRRLYPVGRLDFDSSGLLLVTNDGELANALTHPRYGVEKTYRVRVKGGRIPNPAIKLLATGVKLDDGATTQPAKVTQLAPGEIEIVLREGRNRQIRRMCDAIDRKVTALERIKFGPLELGRLKPGQVRKLSPREVEALWQNVSQAKR